MNITQNINDAKKVMDFFMTQVDRSITKFTSITKSTQDKDNEGVDMLLYVKNIEAFIAREFLIQHRNYLPYDEDGYTVLNRCCELDTYFWNSETDEDDEKEYNVIITVKKDDVSFILDTIKLSEASKILNNDEINKIKQAILNEYCKNNEG